MKEIERLIDLSKPGGNLISPFMEVDGRGTKTQLLSASSFKIFFQMGPILSKIAFIHISADCEAMMMKSLSTYNNNNCIKESKNIF